MGNIGIVAAIAEFLAALLIRLFGTATPAVTTVSEPQAEVDITDGKTEDERRRELGY